MPLGEPEFAENPEARCPVVIVLDTSYSMDGEPIAELNAGLREFKRDVERDEVASLRVEVALVTFGGRVSLVQDFTTIEEFSPPSLTAEGSTPMGEALEFSLSRLESRKQTYKSNGVLYYRPWVFLLTDGAPTDSWGHARDLIHQGESNKSLSFFAVGVDGADFDTLKSIAPPLRPPLRLQGLAFCELFRWLSASMRLVSASRTGGEQVPLPPVTGWAATTT